MEVLRGYRVFIASPGGLDEERRAFRQVFQDLNEDDAYARGNAFIPVGWELTLAGVGRPQELINQEIRRCDYLVLVLWDRWGTPPADDGAYTSGTEEEFEVAMACLKNPGMPMREVVVMFKGASARQLSDPGNELAKVLAFKQRLEAEKTVLYSMFDSVGEFVRHLQRHAQSWLREHGGPTVVEPPEAADDRVGDADDARPAELGSEAEESVAALALDGAAAMGVSDLLAYAEELASKGRLSEAESVYARAVIDRTDIAALTGYARFLRRTGRLSKATEVNNQLLRVAREAGNRRAEVEALANIAIVDRKRGRLDSSRRELIQALAIAEQLGDDALDDVAFLHDNVGLTARKRGALGEALDAHEAALRIRRKQGEGKSIAKSLNNISPLLRQQGKVERATELQDEALAIFSALGYTRGLASAYANRGELHELQGEFREAGDAYAASLASNELLGSPEGIAMNLMQLGRLALRQGDLATAEGYAEKGLASEDFANRPEGTATALQLSGLVLAHKGAYKEAAAVLVQASETYAKCDHVVGLAFTLCDLAEVYLKMGKPRQAGSVARRAKRTAEAVEHAQLWERIGALSEATNDPAGRVTQRAEPPPSAPGGDSSHRL
jgi:tetratricopeptide (TPR) repeat protein